MFFSFVKILYIEVERTKKHFYTLYIVERILELLYDNKEEFFKEMDGYDRN